MFRHLFRIWIKPKDTLDRLLFAENWGQSWAATWVMVVVAMLSSILSVLIISQSKAPNSLFANLEKAMPSLSVSTLLAVGIVFMTIVGVVGQLLARVLYPWYVRMGLRMVAGNVYPRSKEERRAKGRLIQLIHPYTMGIQVLPSLVISVVVDFISLNTPAMNDQNIGHVIGIALLQMLLGLVSLGFMIYMIVVRVIAIRKIYPNVSGAQAFWGPFLIYFFTYLVLMIICVVVVIAAVIAFSGILQQPTF